MALSWTTPTRFLGLGFTLKLWAIIIACVLAVALALFGTGYGMGHGSGYAQATEKAAAAAKILADARHRRDLQQMEALNAANQLNRTKEQEHAARISQLRQEFAQRDAAARAADGRTIADLRAGNKRLRFATTSCRAAGPGAPGPAAAGVDEAGSAELAPEVGAALYSIASDGDAAIRQLTGLQTWADSAVKLCNGSKK